MTRSRGRVSLKRIPKPLDGYRSIDFLLGCCVCSLLAMLSCGCSKFDGCQPSFAMEKLSSEFDLSVGDRALVKPIGFERCEQNAYMYFLCIDTAESTGSSKYHLIMTLFWLAQNHGDHVLCLDTISMETSTRHLSVTATFAMPDTRTRDYGQLACRWLSKIHGRLAFVIALQMSSSSEEVVGASWFQSAKKQFGQELDLLDTDYLVQMYP